LPSGRQSGNRRQWFEKCGMSGVGWFCVGLPDFLHTEADPIPAPFPVPSFGPIDKEPASEIAQLSEQGQFICIIWQMIAVDAGFLAWVEKVRHVRIARSDKPCRVKSNKHRTTVWCANKTCPVRISKFRTQILLLIGLPMLKSSPIRKPRDIRRPPTITMVAKKPDTGWIKTSNFQQVGELKHSTPHKPK
jgi:hypothetical protein